MALKRYERYPGRFAGTNALQPQGAFLNRSAPEAKDGTYLEKDWANDWSGFFSALLVNASIAPNGLVDNATASQYFDALNHRINTLVELQTGVVTGMMVDFPFAAAPVGFLKANGAAVKRADFPKLFARIGTFYGAGDGATTFNVPDARGLFDRSLSDGSGIDAGRGIGTVQASQNLLHDHSATADNQGAHSHTVTTNNAGTHGHVGSSDAQGWHGHGASTSANGSHNHSGGVVGPLVNVAAGLEEGDGHGWPNYRIDGIGYAGDHGHTVYIAGDGIHSHNIGIQVNGDHAHTGSAAYQAGHIHNIVVAASGGNESRPANIAWLKCIKY